MDKHETERMMRALDEGLPPDEIPGLQAHLALCAECRAEWERLQRLERLLRAAPMARPPDGLAGRVVLRLDRRYSRRQRALGGLLFGLGMAAAALLALLPFAGSVWNLAGYLTALLSARDVLFGQVAEALSTLFRSLYLSLSLLAPALFPLVLCGISLLLVAGSLWLFWMRRVALYTVGR